MDGSIGFNLAPTSCFPTHIKAGTARNWLTLIANVSRQLHLREMQVQVSWANDPSPHWREGVAISSEERPLSKLLRAEVPLRRHGRRIKQSVGIVSPRNGLDTPHKGREIVAYDDLL
ncbi:uncharacterized protein At1g27050-like [Telopea speciosissima]|uniref:uncharacterized protein At1g27050-like n=1 Tax=Telopea speciosissima TaxID=54955 RepID=UPI001CC6C365|nr:uncharacterized protein At1g27050-like [Telopea speciosissima]